MYNENVNSQCNTCDLFTAPYSYPGTLEDPPDEQFPECEMILEVFDPDELYDEQNTYLGRNLLFDLAKEDKCPFYKLQGDHTRSHNVFR